MELFKKAIGTLIFGCLIIACNPKKSTELSIIKEKTSEQKTREKIESKDFTLMNIFTNGIEGPAINFAGDLFVVNFKKEGTIGKISNEGKAELFLELPEGSIGNSIQFDSADNMYIADYSGHNIYKVSEQKIIDTLIHHEEFNQPNDIALGSTGMIYASDPNWKESSGKLWLIKNKKAFLLEDSMGTTNGIVLSLDEKKLYVNESVQRNVWVYNINENGEISNKTLFHKFKKFGMDGMKFSPNGNLFIARYGAGTIAVLSPEGILLKEYNLQGENPTNLVFSKNKKSIFVTMKTRKGIERITLE